LTIDNGKLKINTNLKTLFMKKLTILLFFALLMSMRAFSCAWVIFNSNFTINTTRCKCTPFNVNTGYCENSMAFSLMPNMSGGTDTLQGSDCCFKNMWIICILQPGTNNCFVSDTIWNYVNDTLSIRYSDLPTYLGNTYDVEACYKITRVIVFCRDTITQVPGTDRKDTTFCLEPSPSISMSSNSLCTGGFVCNWADNNYLYKWNGCGQTNTWDYNYCIYPSTSCRYTVTVMDTINECQSVYSDSLTIKQTHNVSISINVNKNPVCKDTSVNFTATATNAGSSPTYQWYKQGFPIGGATNTTYSYAPANNDYINCKLWSSEDCPNPQNPSVSNTITMQVDEEPGINDTIPEQRFCEKDTVNFTINASGGSLSYQWSKQGADLTGETNSIFTINNFNQFDANYYYSCKVMNECGMNQLPSFRLNIDYLPKSNIKFTNHVDSIGDTLSFHLIPFLGNPPFTYQWTKDGYDISGATTDSIRFDSITCEDRGIYRCKITNSCGTTTAKIVSLNVVNCPGFDITGQAMYDNTDTTGLCITTVYLYYEGEKLDSVITDDHGN
jgi:hypothetical protein